MKRILTVASTFAMLAMCSAAAAQTTRVAYVDIDRVTEQSDKINKAMGSVQERVEKIQKDMEEKRRRAVELGNEIKKSSGVLAESELKKKKDEASKLEKELVELEYEGKREMQKLDATLFEPMIKTIVLAIQDVAKEKNIDLVLRGEAVIYGANAADITADVVKKLNSPAYNPGGGSESSAKDSESTKSSNSKSEKSSSSSKASSADEETSQGSSEGEGKRSIFPTVPLVTRPVDRQPE